MLTAWEAETLRGMSEREIRRGQAIVAAQIPVAFELGLAAALEQLREWDDAYAAEMLRRLPLA